MANKLTQTLGISRALNAPTPKYKFITDGLIVTETKATAWFDIPIASTQLASADELDDILARAIAAATLNLADTDCHIKVVWSLTEANEYADTADRYTTPSARAWAEARAQAIDAWELPKRHVLLGIDIEDRKDPWVIRSLNAATQWVRGDTRSIPTSELTFLKRKLAVLAKRLGQSVLRARIAPVETLVWLIGREFHRSLTATPHSGTVTGAALAHLANGRIVPWRDHLRIYAETGEAVAYSAVMAITDFPEVVDTTAEGAWLLALSNLTRPDTVDEAYSQAVLPEASVRFRVNSRPQALKQIEKARKSAKEQRQEAAATNAEDPGLDIEMSEAELADLSAEIKRGNAELVTSWPILTLTEPDLDDLEASVDALIGHYASMGIRLERLADQQMEGWLSTLPADNVRIEDYYHVHDVVAFFGSLFWTGSAVGEDDGHVIGYTTGATKNIVRYHPTEHPLRGDSATSLVIGRSGRGKTTSLQLFSLDAAAEGAWVTAIDYKGDLNNEHGGLIGVAQAMGIPARRVDMGAAYGGACDLFALMDAEDSAIHAHSQLMLLISDEMRTAAHPILMGALTERLKQGGERSTAALIQDLLASPEDNARRVGAELAAFSQDSLASLIVTNATVSTRLTTEPGITLVQVPKMDLPDAGTPFEQWTLTNRVSMAVARGILAWITTNARKDELRHVRKLVVVPEAHLFTANPESANFLVRVSRMGRAYGAHLLLDTQDPASVARYEGITEQITTLFCFSLNTAEQQDAAAHLLNLDPSRSTRHAIRNVSVDEDGGVWHGHCLMRDRTGRVATVQIAIPNDEIARALSTTPRRVKVEVAS